MSENDINTLKISMAELTKDIGYIKEALDTNAKEHEWSRDNQEKIMKKIDGFIEAAENRYAAKAEHKESMEKIDGIINALDSKYASKWVEKLLVWIGYTAGAVILVGFLYQIAKAYLHLNVASF